jgi:hypothetical protein
MEVWSDSRPNRFTPGGKKAPIPTEQGDVWAKQPVWSFVGNRTKAVIIAITKLHILSIVVLYEKVECAQSGMLLNKSFTYLFHDSVKLILLILSSKLPYRKVSVTMKN